MKKTYYIAAVLIKRSGSAQMIDYSLYYQYITYLAAFNMCIDIAKGDSRVTNMIIYSNKGTAVNLTRNMLLPNHPLPSPAMQQ